MSSVYGAYNCSERTSKFTVYNIFYCVVKHDEDSEILIKVVCWLFGCISPSKNRWQEFRYSILIDIHDEVVVDDLMYMEF